ncbi:MAG: GntR family transcriptional regulator [Chloroflexi bacterium]|nr:GntR family transcriptional regulator [Chloroflexota bacterium]
MNNLNIPTTTPRTLKENVIQILRQSIIDGSLPSGAELNQVQIAERLGVSRGPVREALGILEQEGLVQSTPYKSVIVTPLTRRYVDELYSVRVALESLALERAIDRLQPEDLEELNGIVETMGIAAHEHDSDRLAITDLEFHEYIVRLADHELVLKLWKQIEVGVQRCLHTQHEIYTFLDEVVGTHPTLVTAMADRDKAAAKQILYDHIYESASHIVGYWPMPQSEGEVENADADVANNNSTLANKDA